MTSLPHAPTRIPAPIRPADAGMPRPAGLADLVGHVPGSVLASPWIGRLARVSFLGALDPAGASPAAGHRARTSRLEHCIGVARLAIAAGRALRLEHDALRRLVTAAFLHDAGHWPFSHSAEAAFRDASGADHHDVTRWIVLGDGAIPRADSLAPALEAAGLDPAGIWSIIDGSDPSPLAALLRGPINLDTLEGIPRAARAFGLRGVRLPARLFEMRDGRIWIRSDAVPALDRFWRLKNRVYRDVINRPALAAHELRFGSVVSASLGPSLVAGAMGCAFVAALPAFDDDALLERLGRRREDVDPRASDLASRFEASADPSTAPVRVLRSYDVDASVRPGPGGLAEDAWSRRWRQARQRWFLVTDDPALQMLLPCLRESETAEL